MRRNGIRGFGVYDGTLIPAPGVVIDSIAAKPSLGDATEVSGGEVVPILGDATEVSGGEVVPILGDATEVSGGEVVPILGAATEIDVGENEVVPILGAGTEVEGGEVVPSPFEWRELRLADAVDQHTPTFDPNDLFFSASDGPSPDGNVMAIRLYADTDAPTDTPLTGASWLWDITPAPGQRDDTTLDPFDGGRLEFAIEIIDEDVSGRWVGTHQPVLLVGAAFGFVADGDPDGRGQFAGFRRESAGDFRVVAQTVNQALAAPSAADTNGRCLHVAHIVYGDGRMGGFSSRPYMRDGSIATGGVRGNFKDAPADGDRWRICVYAGHTGSDAAHPINDLRVRIFYRVLPGVDFPFSP